jgi:hypothetical protein
MRLYKNSWFTRFARKEKIDDQTLCLAIQRAQSGLIDADLGGGLIKQRLARPGEGKSGGYRTIIVFKTKVRALFVFGFAKNDRANLSRDEEALYRKLAKVYLDLTEAQMEEIAASQNWTKVECDEKDV